MYTYVVVDDEKLIRLGLISRVKEITSENFVCVGQAVNGIDGLRLIKETCPDIVITDMKMAKMDGVKFLQQLSEQYPALPVIVISGYKAFDYMNEAIEQGVVGYVLKPFSTEEIEKQLLKAVTKLEQQEKLVKMQEKVDTLEKQTEGKEFLKLILEPWQEGRHPYTVKKWHILISVYTDSPEALNFLREEADRCLGEAVPLCLENPGGNGQYFVLCCGTEIEIGKAEEGLSRFIDNLKRKGREHKLFVAVGKRFYGLENLNKSYQKNERMLREIHLNQPFCFLVEGEKESRKNKVFTEEELRDMMVLLKYGKDNQDKALKQFFGKLSEEDHSLRDIGDACGRLLAKVDDWAISNKVETDDIMGLFYRRYRYQRDLEKIQKEISGYIHLISMSIERKSYGDDYIYEQMIKYIREHYHQKITLQTLADQFYVSAAWCSNILKERMKKGLNTYLAEIRIARAKELLDYTEMSVEQISREIGYPNPKYFFRMFKQMTMFTPIEYRNRRR